MILYSKILYTVNIIHSAVCGIFSLPTLYHPPFALSFSKKNHKVAGIETTV